MLRSFVAINLDLGFHYLIPDYCLAIPTNLLLHQVVVNTTVVDSNPFSISIRPSNGSPDIKVTVNGAMKMSQVKNLINHLIPQNTSLKFVHMGALYPDDMVVSRTKLKEASVLQCLIRPS